MKDQKKTEGEELMRYAFLCSASLISFLFSFYYLQYFVDFISKAFGYFVGGAIIPITAGLLFGLIAYRMSQKYVDPLNYWVFAVFTSISALFPPVYLLLAVTFFNNL